MPDSPASGAALLVAGLTARGETLAVAESLTGGLVCATITDVPGASAVLRGGVVSYATDVKRDVLGVDGVLLTDGGAVQSEVAEQMAAGVRRVLGATWGLATTGVAGPTEQDGHPVGRVFVAAAGPSGTEVVGLQLDGDRAAIRAAAVDAVLALLVRVGLDGRE